MMKSLISRRFGRVGVGMALPMAFAAHAPAQAPKEVGVSELHIGGGDPDGGGPEVCSGDGCAGYIDWPPWISFTVNGTGGSNGGTPCPNGPCALPPPRIRAELLDCDGEVIDSETRVLPGPSCGVNDDGSLPPVPFSETFKFNVCGRIPSRVRVIPVGALASSGPHPPETCFAYWEEASFRAVTIDVPPPPLDGSLSKALLDCWSCEPKDQVSHGRVILQKSTLKARSVRLYSLPDASSEASYGETVNGEFRVPSAGELVVESVGEADAVDVWGATTRDGPGGFDGLTRNGSRIVGSRTMWWDTAPTPQTPKRYAFSIRTYRGSANDFKASFHWYGWNEASCCLQHEVETLEIDVEPLPCELTGRDRAIPELRQAASGADGHIELRLPCCPSCGGEPVCAPGDTSQWFVAFSPDVHDPVMAGKPILDGHGRGWRWEGTTLWSPGTDRLGYVFTNVP